MIKVLCINHSKSKRPPLKNMGCFSSCNKDGDFPDVGNRIAIEIDTTSDSDETLKNGDDLLAGPSLVAFRELNMSSSSSIDVDMGQVMNLLKEGGQNEENKQENESKDQSDDNKMFKDAVPVPDE